jgi:hypothetical protein
MARQGLTPFDLAYVLDASPQYAEELLYGHRLPAGQWEAVRIALTVQEMVLVVVPPELVALRDAPVPDLWSLEEFETARAKWERARRVAQPTPLLAPADFASLRRLSAEAGNPKSKEET